MKLKIVLKVILMACLGSGFVYANSYASDSSGEEIYQGEINEGTVETSLEIVAGLDIGTKIVAIRFSDLIIPKDATITEAYITFDASGSNDGSCSIDIYGEKVTHADSIASTFQNISNRVSRTAKVEWNNVSAWLQGESYQTIDVSPIVQEIVNQSAWGTDKDKMAFIFEKQEGSTRKRRANQENIVLYVTYSVENNPTVVLTSGVEVSNSIPLEVMHNYKISALAGQTIEVLLTGLTANADIYIELGSEATREAHYSLSYNLATSDEYSSFTVPSDGDIYIGVWGNEATDYTLKATLSNEEELLGTSYEDAEDGNADGWTIYDNEPIGATITNVYNENRGSRVIQLSGDEKLNGYILGGSWNNSSEKKITWSMNCNEEFVVYIKVDTDNNQTRYLTYAPMDTDYGLIGEYITIGLGTEAKDGTWRTFTRDLEADLDAFENNNNIVSVEGFLIRGSGLIDDITLHNSSNVGNDDITPPLITLNGDSTIMLTQGQEYTELGAIANDNVDGDISGNIIIDSSNVNKDTVGTYSVTYNVTDVAGNIANEVIRTVNVINLNNVSIYEDAEDGNADGWTIYDNPANATITNVYNENRGSRVIQLSGDEKLTGYILGGSWGNISEKEITWSMNYNEEFVVYISVETTNGHRYLTYAPVDTDYGLIGKYITIGLGTEAKDGIWRTFTRDLEADLDAFENNNNIVSVEGFLIRGSGLIDDIFMGTNIPNSNPCSSDNINRTTPCSVSTFHNISLYWSPYEGREVTDVEKERNVTILYKKVTEDDIAGNWKKAQDMIYSPIVSSVDYNHTSGEDEKKDIVNIEVNPGDIVSKGDYRGSIVNLEPNTTYSIKMMVGEETKELIATTWNEEFKIDSVYSINDLDVCEENNNKSNCKIVKSGSKENGYVVIDGGGVTLNGENSLDYNLHVEDQSYIIIKNFNLKGATEHAVYLQNSHHIVVEDCNISDWGHEAKNQIAGIDYGDEKNSAIFSDSNLYSSVFQRNRIFNPNYTSNSWGYRNNTSTDNPTLDYHPEGAQGITLVYCRTGNNVIRYNEFYTNNGNYFNDIVGGASNGGHYGFPGADSDIYGNYLANSHDEGIEAEGGGENVRIWNNYIEDTYSAIGNAVTSVGPLYIWRNVAGKAKLVDDNESDYSDNDRLFRGPFLKMGATRNTLFMMTGQIYVYNNTLLNHDNNGYGGIGTTEKKVFEDGQIKFSDRVMKNITTRNNILHVPVGVNSISKDTEIKGQNPDDNNESYAYDMVNSVNQVPDFYAINHIDENGDKQVIENNNPNYTAGNPILNGDKTADFSLLADYSNKTLCIPNMIPYAHPDVGAQEGDTDMHFGIQAPYFIPPNYQLCPE